MASMFPRPWHVGAFAYIGITLVLAAYAFGADHATAQIVLLVSTLPVSFLLLWPIYLSVAMVDHALGYGLGPSPWGMAIFVGGFGVAAMVNVVMLRMIVLAFTRRFARFLPASPH